MTIAAAESTASLPTLAELHDSTLPAPSPWVRLNVKPRRVEPCTCDPTVPHQCLRCYIADDTAFGRSQDI